MSSPSAPANARHPRRDAVCNVTATALYSLALAMITVVFPLFALEAGYDAASVGAIVAASAITQILARASMGWLMRHVADKHLIAGSALLLAISSAMLLLSAALWVVLASQLVQGVSRALFWTANQSHAVRAHPSAVRGLAQNSFWNGLGSLFGPLLCALLLAVAPIPAPIAMSSAVAAVTVVPSILLVRFRPYERITVSSDGSRLRPLWARPELLPPALMSTSAGAWRGLLNSLVPVVLVQAGHSDATASLLLACANAAVLFAAPLARFVLERGLVFMVVASAGPIAVGLVTVGTFPQITPLAAVALFLSGIGGGLTQTLGPSSATAAVHPEERGQAIASIGTFRAVALFVTPLAAAALVPILPATLTLVVVTLVSAAPSVALTRLQRGS